MDTLQSHLITAAFSVAVGIILTLVKQRFDPTAKLIWGDAHQFWFGLGGHSPQTTVVTHTMAIENNGRAPAENVEVIFTYTPQFFQVYPPRQFSEAEKDRHCVLTFPSVAPRERFTIEIMAIGPEGMIIPPPAVVLIRSKTVLAKHVPLAPMPILLAWLAHGLIYFAIFGICTALYFLGRLIWPMVESLLH